MDLETQRFVIPSTPESLGPMRDQVAQLLAATTASPQYVQDAQVVLCELLTNAIHHGAPPVEVQIQMIDGSLIIEVTDRSPSAIVQPPTPDPGRIGGWGLTIVISLSVHWGVRRHHENKVVWAEMPKLTT